MTLATDFLPNDLQALKALVSAQRAEIERLNMMIAKLRRMQFGRNSEQLDAMIDQLQLSLEEWQVIQTELTPPTEPPPRVASRRKPLPEHLLRELHVHPPESQCSGCGGKLRQLGEDVSEVLEYVPARFKVIRHVRPKMVCSCCEHIAQVPAPSRPIVRDLAGPGLLAHVLVSKFVDHLPLYRQSEIYAREGVDLERSTLADWVGQSSHQACLVRFRPILMTTLAGAGETARLATCIIQSRYHARSTLTLAAISTTHALSAKTVSRALQFLTPWVLSKIACC